MNSTFRFKNFKIDNFLQIIFILLPYSLIFSIFLTEIFCLILTFFYFKENTIKLSSTIKENKIIKLLFIFYFIIILSTILNIDDLKIILKNLSYIRYIFYALSISWILNKFILLKKLFLYSLLSSFIVLCFGAIYEFAFKRICITFNENSEPFFNENILYCSKQFFLGNLIRSDRISSFFGDEMIVGSFVSRLLPLLCLIYLDSSKSNKQNNLILFIVLFVSLSTVLLSGERVSLFYTTLFLIILFIFTNFKFKLIYFFSILIFSFIFISNSPILKKRFFDQTFDQVLSSHNQEKKIIFFSIQHESHAISALKMFYDKPILGIGPKNFRNECKKPEYKANKDYPIELYKGKKNKDYSCSTHPHNFYIQLLSETGIFGIIIPLIFFISIIKFFIRSFYLKIINKKNNIDMSKIFLYSCFLITFFPVLPTGNIFNNWMSLIFYIPLGFYLNLRKI